MVIYSRTASHIPDLLEARRRTCCVGRRGGSLCFQGSGGSLAVRKLWEPHYLVQPDCGGARTTVQSTTYARNSSPSVTLASLTRRPSSPTPRGPDAAAVYSGLTILPPNSTRALIHASTRMGVGRSRVARSQDSCGLGVSTGRHTCFTSRQRRGGTTKNLSRNDRSLAAGAHNMRECSCLNPSTSDTRNRNVHAPARMVGHK